MKRELEILYSYIDGAEESSNYQKCKEHFNNFLNEWLEILKDINVFERYTPIEKNGIIVLKGDGFSITFEEEDHPIFLAENGLKWQDGMGLSADTITACISGDGILPDNNLYYCHIERISSSEKWVFDFRQFHDRGETKMHLEGKSENRFPYCYARAERDVSLQEFLSAMGRYDVYLAYNNFVKRINSIY